MVDRPLPWRNVVVRYCLKCRLKHPKGASHCRRCGGELVDQVRRQKLDDR